ncbi:uncharacterized protein [Typha latifolia]|uniref:uncharacterized protein n=1 Tax=Typha latifolia TaxID=4733 RepID=UPI003C2F263D
MARDILGDTIGSSVASGGSGRSPLTASSSDLNAGAPEFVPRSAAFQNHRVIKIHQHPPHQLAPPPVIPVFHMSPVGNPSAFLAPMLGHRAFGYYGGGGSGKFGDTEVKSVGGAGFGYAGQGRALGGRYPQDKQAGNSQRGD